MIYEDHYKSFMRYFLLMDIKGKIIWFSRLDKEYSKENQWELFHEEDIEIKFDSDKLEGIFKAKEAKRNGV